MYDTGTFDSENKNFTNDIATNELIAMHMTHMVSIDLVSTSELFSISSVIR